MENEETREALRRWDKEYLVEASIGLNSLLEASAVRREAAEAKIAQLEELRSSFESRMERAAGLVDEGELNDYWRGNRDALQVCLAKLAALSPNEAPEKEGEDG